MTAREPKIGDIVEYINPNYSPAQGAIGQVFEYIADPRATNGHRYYIRWDWPPANYQMDHSGEHSEAIQVICPVEKLHGITT